MGNIDDDLWVVVYNDGSDRVMTYREVRNEFESNARNVAYAYPHKQDEKDKKGEATTRSGWLRKRR